jgi:type II secretory pathway pseudopilin PulG
MRYGGIKSLIHQSRFIASRRGYTIIEVLAVIVIMFALVVIAVAKFDMSATEIDAMSRVLRSNLQLSQDMAMTQGSTFGFRIISTTTYEIYEGTPGTPARDPLTQGDFVVDISPVTFTTSGGVAFNSAGRPDSATDVVIGLTDSGGRMKTITVSKNTGFVQISMFQRVFGYGSLVAMSSP